MRDYVVILESYCINKQGDIKGLGNYIGERVQADSEEEAEEKMKYMIKFIDKYKELYDGEYIVRYAETYEEHMSSEYPCIREEY